MAELTDLLLIGDGRLASHLRRYFEQLHLRHVEWSRRLEAQKICPRLDALVHARTRVLLAISDGAIEPFVQSHPELAKTVRVHFSGRLATPLAVGAHPLFSFAGTYVPINTMTTTVVLPFGTFVVSADYAHPATPAPPAPPVLTASMSSAISAETKGGAAWHWGRATCCMAEGGFRTALAYLKDDAPLFDLIAVSRT